MALPRLGYVRVSNVGGRRGDSFRSPQDQEEAMRDWARRAGEWLELLPHELDVSGARDDRPIFGAAVARVERGEACGLLVAYQSRAARSARNLLNDCERIERAGGTLLSATENIDPRTRDGRLMRTILAGIHEHEHDGHRERFDHLREAATAAGIWQRRQTPLGYRRGERRRLEPDGRADDVVAAFRARVAGASISALARRLGMTPSGVRQLLRNRVYLGELRVGRHVNSAAHPALVDEELFVAAQHVLTPRPARNVTAGGPALLAGLVRCAGCGHVMTRSGGGGTPMVYTCRRQHSAGDCREPASITARLLDEHAEKIVISELARLRVEARHDDRAVREARAALAVAEHDLISYLEMVDLAGLELADAAAAARQRRERRDEARAELGRLLAERPPAVDGDPVALWGRLDAGQRNLLLRSLVECVVVRRARGAGRRVSVNVRVRVVAHGAGVAPVNPRGGVPLPVERIAFPGPDDPRVLRVEVGEHPLDGAG